MWGRASRQLRLASYFPRDILLSSVWWLDGIFYEPGCVTMTKTRGPKMLLKVDSLCNASCKLVAFLYSWLIYGRKWHVLSLDDVKWCDIPTPVLSFLCILVAIPTPSFLCIFVAFLPHHPYEPCDIPMPSFLWPSDIPTPSFLWPCDIPIHHMTWHIPIILDHNSFDNNFIANVTIFCSVESEIK